MSEPTRIIRAGTLAMRVYPDDSLELVRGTEQVPIPPEDVEALVLIADRAMMVVRERQQRKNDAPDGA